MIVRVYVEDEVLRGRSANPSCDQESGFAVLVADQTRPEAHALGGVFLVLLTADDVAAHFGRLKNRSIRVALTAIKLGGQVPILQGHVILDATDEP